MTDEELPEDPLTGSRIYVAFDVTIADPSPEHESKSILGFPAVAIPDEFLAAPDPKMIENWLVDRFAECASHLASHLTLAAQLRLEEQEYPS